MIVKIETTNLETNEPDIVEITNPEIHTSHIPGLNTSKTYYEVWLEGICAKCGDRVVFYFLFPGEEPYSECEPTSCKCGVYTGQGYLADNESIRIIENLLKEKNLQKEKTQIYRGYSNFYYAYYKLKEL